MTKKLEEMTVEELRHIAIYGGSATSLLNKIDAFDELVRRNALLVEKATNYLDHPYDGDGRNFKAIHELQDAIAAERAKETP